MRDEVEKKEQMEDKKRMLSIKREEWVVCLLAGWPPAHNQQPVNSNQRFDWRGVGDGAHGSKPNHSQQENLNYWFVI